jgi:folate-binding protein YgfZ
MPCPALLPRLKAAQAHLTETDPALVLTFGDVPAEYAAAREGSALFDASDRDAVLISGGDAREFLHRLLSNYVVGPDPGQGNRTLLLSPTGKVRADLDFVVLAEDSFRLEGAPGIGAPLVEALDRFLFAEDVALEDVSATHAPLELCGPEARATLAGFIEEEGAALPDKDHAFVRLESVESLPGILTITRIPVAGQAGWRLDAGADGVGPLWDKLIAAGATPSGFTARESLRVEANLGRWGADITEAVYPQEARLEDAFSLDKGCYIGQEVVAKIDTYEGLNKRLTLLRCEGDDPVPTGTRLFKEDGDTWRNLGFVTTWAWSFKHDIGTILAYVKRGHQKAETRFRLGDGPEAATIFGPPEP